MNLKWNPDRNIESQALHRREDSKNLHPPLHHLQNTSEFELMQSFSLDQIGLLTEAIGFGVNAPEISIKKEDAVGLNLMLNEIDPSDLNLHFRFEEGAVLVHVLYHLEEALRNRGKLTDRMRGSLRWGNRPPFRDLDREISELLPGFKFIFFESSDKIDQYSRVDQLVQVFVPLLNSLENTQLPVKDFLKKSIFRVYTGNDFISEVAKIRAFHKIWALVLEELNIKAFPPDLELSLAPGAYEKNIYHNFIRNAAAALNFSIGGVRRIHFSGIEKDPQGKVENPESFGNRINANIFHMLTHESHMDKVIDPAAGSFTIESLSDEMAEKAWSTISAKV